MELYITTAPKGDGCSVYIVIKINWKRDKRLVFTALDSTQYNIIVLGDCTGSYFTRVGVRPLLLQVYITMCDVQTF